MSKRTKFGFFLDFGPNEIGRGRNGNNLTNNFEVDGVIRIRLLKMIPTSDCKQRVFHFSDATNKLNNHK